MSEKEQFIRLASQPNANISQLCRSFGISRPTGYLWLKRYAKEGKNGLIERSRKPQCSPHQTEKSMEELIVLTRLSHPQWGGDKIKTFLINQGHTKVPTEKTIDRILKRYGCINPEESQKRQPFIRFEHEHPNDLWQMDFKGHFPLGQARCHPLTLLDDHSRFCLLIKACANEQGETVKSALISVFKEYGLPRRMTMDNGPPWGYSGNQQRYTELCAWLIRLGIQVSHSRPRHPQTQGKLERFHRTLNGELIQAYSLEDMEEAQLAFDWWRKMYNEERPHDAIGMLVPKRRYEPSQIKYPEKLRPIEYSSDLEVRKVNSKGEIYFKGKVFKIGNGFQGNPVGLKESEEEGLFDVYFCHQKVLKIDIQHPCSYM
jgi:transposase InsO family protein